MGKTIVLCQSMNADHYIGMPRKTHRIIVTDAKTALDIIPFMVKTLRKTGIEGNFLNLIKNIYKTLMLPSHLLMKDNALPLRWGTR